MLNFCVSILIATFLLSSLSLLEAARAAFSCEAELVSFVLSDDVLPSVQRHSTEDDRSSCLVFCVRRRAFWSGCVEESCSVCPEVCWIASCMLTGGLFWDELNNKTYPCGQDSLKRFLTGIDSSMKNL